MATDEKARMDQLKKIEIHPYSEMDLIKNADGSVDIYMGPDAPMGKEENWIPTVAGKAWFPYFRLYSPKKAFLDRTWVLPDIVKRK
jgi:hypothetical protein